MIYIRHHYLIPKDKFTKIMKLISCSVPLFFVSRQRCPHSERKGGRGKRPNGLQQANSDFNVENTAKLFQE